MTGWIPRSKSFYAIVSTVGSGSFYIWWDRHQSKQIQEQFERECSVFGGEPVKESTRLTKLTFLLAARDSNELANRKKLFRKHIAKLLLKAGIDWQVIDINEQSLAKAINELRLDDEEHKELQFIDRSELVEAVATKWCSPDFVPDGGKSIEYLLNKIYMAPNSCIDGVVALDSATFDSLKIGLLKGREMLKQNIGSHATTSWFSKMWPRKPDGQLATEPSIDLIDVSLPTSFWSKVYCLLNTRYTTTDLCQQTTSLIVNHSQRGK